MKEGTASDLAATKVVSVRGPSKQPIRPETA